MPANTEANGAEVSDAQSDNEHEYNGHDHSRGEEDDDDRMAGHQGSPDPGNENGAEAKKKYDPKDPHRPRRKKARRACYACQRAHLTCGDERPCQRCIKRGLADACQDGVRKKAKYLHDAPPEALRPVLGPTYNPSAAAKPQNGRHPSNATDTSYYSQQSGTTQSFPMFTPSATSQVGGLPENMSFNQQSPVSPTFQSTTDGHSVLGSMSAPPPPVSAEVSNNGFGVSALFDPSNPALYNFDLEALNFGNQYGAMEFGILNQMSNGAAETPPREGSMSQPAKTDASYGPIFSNGGGYNMYDNSLGDNFLNLDQSFSQNNLQHGLPHAFAVAAAGPTPNSLNSPGTDNTASPQATPTGFGFEKSPKTTGFPSVGIHPAPQAGRSKHKNANGTKEKISTQALLGKRQRDPSSIYETVKEPYPYLTGFHNLIALVQRRFSANKTLRIAKSLASIRPSFIATTRTLNRQDLIFMEKCLQRTLFEYEDFMGHCAAPTIVCRRTGEVAAVNKEFIALTGWTKDVLLGKEANRNVNLGGDSSSPQSLGNSGKAGLSTPRLKGAQPDTTDTKGLAAAGGANTDGASSAQPVFIAEFMDDDSVVQFYEDFASLAFGDSRGHVTRKCRLLKYRTKEMTESLASFEDKASHQQQQHQAKDPRASILSNRVSRIDGEHGISKLEKDGKMDCTFCWTIKRDVFDIPMLIVMNFLPCYYRNQDQLAV
ncbi:uncharacterized protein B0I36DRAFT_146728 [Microdochium trichocladiopsis]|uniref:Zn(2)-C6 fungal-type domain-containing protein n=1 Tax=Microdochium trichocladiopsis TaxID=1682393 RepID=A0A9P8Y508_9PEZI|nr:uncharacterized protein B0I36DRAFT_146728 [Microdochium trichocladiopsis]KAH7028062.1 hypothetical protein B0I36DRAFT_146728 [Microdochium trichocladiopsis]